MITSLCMFHEGEHQGFKKVMEEIENDQGRWEVGKRRQTLVVRPGGYVGSNWLMRRTVAEEGMACTKALRQKERAYLRN